MKKSKDKNFLKSLWSKAVAYHRLLRGSRSKDLLIFLLFVCVSYVFWLILTLNDDMQSDVKVRLEISDVPADVTFISEMPENIQVSVRDKGTSLFNYSWGGSPLLKINYSDFTYDALKDRIVLGEQQLNSLLRGTFGTSAQIVSMRPDSLSLTITDRPATLAVVSPQIEVTAAAQSVIFGPITVSPDTVKIYSARYVRVDKLPVVETVKITRSDAKDTLHIEAPLVPESGIRMVPDKVTITVPVEPLIAKTREVSVQIVGASNPKSIVMFPSRVKVSYLLPMSLYNSESGIVTVSANYAHRSANKIPLDLGALPDYYQSVELLTDSVEYLIEQPTALSPSHSTSE